MKYVNRIPLKIVFFLRGGVKAFSILLIVCFVASCANTNKQNQWDFDGKGLVVLVDTEQYLPIQTRDEAGQLLPYQPKPNLYAELSGRIDKTAVTAYIEARRAFGSQNYQEADRYLAQIIAEEPKLSGPWVMRGDIAYQEGNLEKAVEYYAKAIEVNQVNFNAWLRLAKVQRERGHYRHAQNTYARALALWPDAPEAHLNLGVLYDVYLNQPLKAQAHMEAYQLLQVEENQEASAWLNEVRSRTGIASTLKVLGPNGELELLTNSPQTDISTPDTDASPQLVVSGNREE